MNPASGATVGSVGEFDLIERLTRRFRHAGSGVVRGIGDDTAALQVTPGNLLLATTDATVEGVHFILSSTTPRDLGRRVLAVNLSDIAAMGGIPRWCLVSLSLPTSVPLDVVDELAEGMGEEAANHETAIVGGNVARSPDRLVLDVTLLGEVEPELVLYRRGARPGDRILVTGTLGDSAAGLAILLNQAPADLPGSPRLVARHRVPRARVEAGRAIARSRCATSMIDLSDGLASDLRHIAEASHVGAVVALDRVPMSPALVALASATRRDPAEWALRGGEDYELLVTAPVASVPVLQNAVGAGGVALTDVGEITAAPELWVAHPSGRREPLGAVSWHHFGAP